MTKAVMILYIDEFLLAMQMKTEWLASHRDGDKGKRKALKNHLSQKGGYFAHLRLDVVRGGLGEPDKEWLHPHAYRTLRFVLRPKTNRRIFCLNGYPFWYTRQQTKEFVELASAAGWTKNIAIWDWAQGPTLYSSIKRAYFFDELILQHRWGFDSVEPRTRLRYKLDEMPTPFCNSTDPRIGVSVCKEDVAKYLKHYPKKEETT